MIYIEASTGNVKRVGRSDEFANQFDLDADEFVPIPRGDVHKKKEVVQVREPLPGRPGTLHASRGTAASGLQGTPGPRLAGVRSAPTCSWAAGR